MFSLSEGMWGQVKLFRVFVLVLRFRGMFVVLKQHEMLSSFSLLFLRVWNLYSGVLASFWTVPTRLRDLLSGEVLSDELFVSLSRSGRFHCPGIGETAP